MLLLASLQPTLDTERGPGRDPLPSPRLVAGSGGEFASWEDFLLISPLLILPPPHLDTEVPAGAEGQFAVYQHPGQNVAGSALQVLPHSQPGAPAALLSLEGWGGAGGGREALHLLFLFSASSLSFSSSASLFHFFFPFFYCEKAYITKWAILTPFKADSWGALSTFLLL